MQVTYRDFLVREYRLRKQRNSGYSMKAFARDLGLQDSKLSEILAGKKGLSVERARRVAGALKLSSRDSDLFITMVRAVHSRSRAEREKYHQKLAQKTALKTAVMEAERFRVVADWQHFAILEILGMGDSSVDVNAIAKRLDVPSTEVKQALLRLESVGLILKDGPTWIPRKEIVETPDDVPSQAIRQHHHQILGKAQAALELGVELREFQSVMMSSNPADLVEAKRFVRDMIEEFCKRFGAGRAGSKLFALGIQFFPLDQMKEGKSQ